MKRPLAVFSDKSVLLEKRLHVPRSILDSSNVGYNDAYMVHMVGFVQKL